MKIYIVGPCSTGKSTLAKKLSKEKKIKSYSLDDFYIDFESIVGSDWKIFSREKIEKDIDVVLNQKNWIVEGPYYEKKLAQTADVIIYTRRTMETALIWQWKRFFNDPIQIRKWGLYNNLLLSKIIVNQFLKKEDKFKFKGAEYVTVSFVDRKLVKGKMRDKVQVLGHKNSVPVIE